LKVVSIIHFQPIEKYPPAFNFIRLLASKNNNADFKINLLTTDPGLGWNKIDINGVSIKRIGKWGTEMNRTFRIVLYLRFLVGALFLIWWQKPSALMYYESLSAGAPYFYKIWLRRNCKLFIHYHEYTTPEEYESGMKLNRWLHKLEFYLYPLATWISHTNEDRLRFFLRDVNMINLENCYVLPNHPPAYWANLIYPPTIIPNKIGFVYIGALSLDTMYVKEIAAYIAVRKENCYWDIYSNNHTSEAIRFLIDLKAENIYFRGSIQYDELPRILELFQVGLILYKGHISNYIYNIPNKLFEYYVCGLDIWFPVQMLSCKSLITSDTYPKVISINYEELGNVSMQNLTDRRNLRFEKQEYTCESTYAPLLNELLKMK